MAQANDFDMLEQIMHLDSISESSISSLQILSDVRLNRYKVDEIDESSDDDDELLFCTQAGNSNITSSMAFLEDR